jgi:hypothetical protein
LARDESVALFAFRNVYAAAPLVANPLFRGEASGRLTPEAIDWIGTGQRLRTFFALGMGVAFPMDTAQRGTQIVDWSIAAELIKLAVDVGREYGHPERVICGAGADSVRNPSRCSMADVIDSYVAQTRFIQERGATPILFPNTILPQRFPSQSSYEKLIDSVMEQVEGDVYLHWLGAAFNGHMASYWGHEDVQEAAEKTVLPLMERHQDKIRGIKLSTLDQGLEESMRERIGAHAQIVLTGDDFNFPHLIEGNDRGFSHALLGIFGGTASVAAKALELLAQGDSQGYHALMDPLAQLSRHIFEPPTGEYKVGLTLIAYLNGEQSHFRMVGGIEGHRSLLHLVELFKLADAALVLADPQEAYERFRPILIQGGCRV